MRAELGRDVLGETLDDPDRVLERVPAGDLEDERRVLRRGPSSTIVARRSTRPGAPSGRWKQTSLRRVAVREDPARAQDGQDHLRLEVLVLGGEHVDRGRDHGDPLSLEALPGERLAREDVGVRRLDVRAEEVPGLPRQIVGLVHADVAAPDDPRPLGLQRRDHPGRLRVMHDHDVAFAHPS